MKFWDVMEIVGPICMGLCFLFGLMGLLSNDPVNEALGGLCILALICLAFYRVGTKG
jgi:hypothetical protein